MFILIKYDGVWHLKRQNIVYFSFPLYAITVAVDGHGSATLASALGKAGKTGDATAGVYCGIIVVVTM